jgi:hypothetical protein
MHARFEGFMKMLWQLEQGGVKLSNKVNFQLDHDTSLLHILSW